MSVKTATIAHQAMVLGEAFLQKGFAVAIALVMVSCTDIPEQFVPRKPHMNGAKTYLDVESTTSNNNSWRVEGQNWYENGAFPDISSVPSHSPSVTPTAERRAILEELLTDRANACKLGRW